MGRDSQFRLLSSVVLLVVLASAGLTTPAAADDEAPPAPDVPVQEALDASGAADEVVGQPDGYATDEAERSVSVGNPQAAVVPTSGDPMWCPLGATPVAFAGGCTANYASFALLLAGPAPTANGVIWARNGAAPDALNLDGSFTWSTAVNYTLALKGGWLGEGSTAVDGGDPTYFSNEKVTILNWKANVTLSDIEVTGVLAGVALRVGTTKNITLANVSVHDNASGGASLDTCQQSGPTCTGAGTISVTSSTFNDNAVWRGLDVNSNGSITLKMVEASGNGQQGAYLQNNLVSSTALIKVISVYGPDYANTYNENGGVGLQIESRGPVTIQNVTAMRNSSWGAYVDNCQLAGACQGIGAVNILGANITSDNNLGGLYVKSNGNIKANNLTAISNTGAGAQLSTSSASVPRTITLTGSSQFSYNGGSGLTIWARGNVTLNNIQANGTGGTGLDIDTCGWTGTQCGKSGNVLITGTNIFQDNLTRGLEITANGSITLYNVAANSNGFSGGGWEGAYLDNCQSDGATCKVIAKPVILYGTNIFNWNRRGLFIWSGGAINASNLTVTGTQDYEGAYLRNGTAGAVGGVTLNGTNTFNENSGGNGLLIETRGAVSLKNITAIGNGSTSSHAGVFIGNALGAAKPVTLGGTNTLSGNEGYGLYVYSAGLITVNNMTASYNGGYDSIGHTAWGYGARIENTAGSSAGVTLTGTNVFNENHYQGLWVSSHGAIKVSNLRAANNFTYDGAVPAYYGGNGVVLRNYEAAGSPGVVLSGSSALTGNRYANLLIQTKGSVTLSNITASGSLGGDGLYVDACTWDGVAQLCKGAGNVTITGRNFFEDNHSNGLSVEAGGAITLYDITAIRNGLASGGYGTYLNNCESSGGNCTVTAKAVTLYGTNLFEQNNGSGLHIYSGGSILVNNATARDNDSYHGMWLVNNETGAVGNVTMTGMNFFTGNKDGAGLYIQSLGAVTLWNLTSISNGLSSGGTGVWVNNMGAGTKAVKLNGNNNLSGNQGYGLDVFSDGPVTINNLTASRSQTGGGASVATNYHSATVFAVMLTGTNRFEQNASTGLSIDADGMVSLNNLYARWNQQTGVYVDNTDSGVSAPRKVQMTGVGIFTENNATGLQIRSYGAINLLTTRIISDGNGTGGNHYGVDLNNCLLFGVCQGAASITIKGVSQFNGNYQSGLHVLSGGTIAVSNVTAMCNGMLDQCQNEQAMAANGISLSNLYAASGHPAVKLTGTNLFIRNRDTGLVIESLGAISINNVTSSFASHSGGRGATLDNDATGASGGVTLTGVNVFNQNPAHGLEVSSLGAITAANVTANDNGGSGAYLDNHTAGAPANVVLTGTNRFDYNTLKGLEVHSLGAITISNLNASHNSNQGAWLENDYGGSSGGVTLTGVSTLDKNTSTGLHVESFGDVTLTRVSASGNLGGGLYLNTTQALDVTCGNFSKNTGSGLDLTAGVFSVLSGVQSVDNTAVDSLTGPIFWFAPCLLP